MAVFFRKKNRKLIKAVELKNKKNKHLHIFWMPLNQKHFCICRIVHMHSNYFSIEGDFS